VGEAAIIGADKKIPGTKAGVGDYGDPVQCHGQNQKVWVTNA
jgi:hypothetical protein